MVTRLVGLASSGDAGLGSAVGGRNGPVCQRTHSEKLGFRLTCQSGWLSHASTSMHGEKNGVDGRCTPRDAMGPPGGASTSLRRRVGPRRTGYVTAAAPCPPHLKEEAGTTGSDGDDVRWNYGSHVGCAVVGALSLSYIAPAATCIYTYIVIFLETNACSHVYLSTCGAYPRE